MRGNFERILTETSLYKRNSKKNLGKRDSKKNTNKLNKRNPGCNIKASTVREISKANAFKGGNIEMLRHLREEKARANHVNVLNSLNKTHTSEIKVSVASSVSSLEDRLADIRKRKEEQHNERKNTVIEDGFLYLVTSPAYPGWTKVGQTSDYENRLSTYQTCSPFADYEMPVKKWVENRIEAEKNFISLASMIFEVRGEWINALVEDLITEF